MLFNALMQNAYIICAEVIEMSLGLKQQKNARLLRILDFAQVVMSVMSWEFVQVVGKCGIGGIVEVRAGV